MAGHQPETMPLTDYLDASYAVMIDGGLASTKLRDDLDGRFELMWPDRDTWGESPHAQEGMAAMMDLAGGPAPPREESSRPRPARRTPEPDVRTKDGPTAG